MYVQLLSLLLVCVVCGSRITQAASGDDQDALQEALRSDTNTAFTQLYSAAKYALFVNVNFVHRKNITSLYGLLGLVY